MCGLVGFIGSQLPTNDVIERMRDRLEHRGPDSAGLWRSEATVLGHRRLAVLDPTEAGHQPMISDDGRCAIAYNGELYNERELRRTLGTAFRSGCDTETLLAWMTAGLPIRQLRGMFAFAFVDLRARTLTLARDPLGIKPMYWVRCGGGVAFASEPPALFEHPAIDPEPDPLGVSAYLTTIRTTLDDRTMFRGVRTLRPGEVLTFDLTDADGCPERSRIELPERPAGGTDAGTLRRTIDDSITRHLRTDVPLCSLLSGGLDSTIIAGLAAEHHPGLRTYCAGVDEPGSDSGFARGVAAALRTRHTHVPIDQGTFLSEWLDTVGRLGLPLSTPNEVAIRLVARKLRADGAVVALSGEGADELLAGYDLPLRLALEHEAGGLGSPGRFQLDAHAWIGVGQKHEIVSDEMRDAIGGDEDLIDSYERLFAESACGTDGLPAHLRFQQRVNLPGLLQRLDTSTMLESVEGRVPFADTEVLAAARAIPIGLLHEPAGGTVAARTKLLLRSAYRGRVPADVLARDKASFPLPFQDWMPSVTRLVQAEGAIARFIRPAAVRLVASGPGRYWNAAWPILNLALWAERWWGDGASRLGDQEAVAASVLGTAASSRRV